MQGRSPKHEPHGGSEVAVIAVAVTTCVTIGLAAWMATRGLDRTDEGFYLNSIANPTDSRSAVVLFGYVYHPLFVLLGEDVVRLRWAGIGASVLSMGWLAHVTSGTPALIGQPLSAALRRVVSLGVGASTLLTMAQLPGTPSYNSLSLQGLALTATGLVLAVTRPDFASTAGAALVGLGGCITFFAKPTTAALLAVIVLLAVLLTPLGRRHRARIIIVATLAFLTATVVFAAGRLLDLYDVLANGYTTTKALGGHENLIRLDAFPGLLSAFVVIAAAAALATTVFSLAQHRAGRQSSPHRRLAATTALLTMVSVGAWVIVGLAVRRWNANAAENAVAGSNGSATLLAGCGVTIGIAVLRHVQRARWRDRTCAEDDAGEEHAARRTAVTLLGVLLLLPPTYALGTNVNLWSAQGRATCFWLLALVVLLLRHEPRLRWAPLVPVLTALTLLAALLLASAMMPYRYEPLRTATSSTRVGSGSVLLTGEDHAQVLALNRIRRTLQMTDRTRVLDLTGDTPGSIFILGAHAVGQAWILGGYPGSEQAARLAIERDRCSLQGALLFVAERSPRAIPLRVLHTVGLDAARDYVPVASFSRPRPSQSRSDEMDIVTVLQPRPGTTEFLCRR